MTLTTLVPVAVTGGNFANIPPDSVQLSIFEPVKTGSGTVTDIPSTSGRIVGVSIRSTIWQEVFAGANNCAGGANSLPGNSACGSNYGGQVY